MELSVEQQLAVYTNDSKVLVCSAAGSGKTTCLVERVKYLLYEKEVNPNGVFAITFTNMAAQEMIQRLGERAQNSFIGTIHSLANKILLANRINTHHLIESENFDEFFNLLSEHKDTLKVPEVEYLLIDEYQDICQNEYWFMTEILKPKNFWAVGDSRQAIYGFKGANHQFFMTMTEDPFATIYELCDCYRCGPEIIDFSNYLLKGVKNIYRTPVRCHNDYGYSAVEEDEFSYAALLAGVQEINDYKNTAILCRSNRMVDDVMFFLKQNGIPSVTFKKADKTLETLQLEMENEAVKVLTIHSAKGLEWDNVIVCPEIQAYNEEEKRITYVAATRAKKYLLWLAPIKKRFKGKQKGLREMYIDSQMEDWG